MAKEREPYQGLKGWLVANSISQQRVADLLNTTPNYVNKKLNGTGSDFKLSEARKMHELLGAPMSYFFELKVPEWEQNRIQKQTRK